MPQNVGNILRTAMATGSIVDIIGPLPFSLDDKSLKRVGMDYLLEAKYIVYRDFDEFEKTHQKSNIFYVTRYSHVPYTTPKYNLTNEDLFIMFGNESTGIDKDILKRNYDKTVRIPMMPNARSLNLSNSVAIVVYEVLRQKGFPDLATSDVIKGGHTID